MNNLFFISQAGQVVQYESYIAKNEVHNSVAIILWTEKNVEIRDKMLMAVSKNNSFSHVNLIQLPVTPNGINLSSVKLIDEIYNQILFDNDCKDIYISSVEFHYSLLKKIADRKNINVHLIEEGTGTYRYESSKYKLQYSFLHNLKTAIKKSKLKHNTWVNIIFVIKKAIVDIFKVPKVIFDFFIIFYESSFVQAKLIERKYPSFLKRADGFSSVNVTFVDMIKDIYKADKYNYFFAYDKLENSNTFEFEKDSIIFANQNYGIDFSLQIKLIIDILQCSYPDRHIYIKLHPKESRFNLLELKKVLDSLPGGNVNYIDTNDSLESIISNENITMVTSIASTSLVYANEIRRDIDAVSISTPFIDEIMKHKKYKKNVSTIMEHSDILRKFKNVFFLDNLDSLDSLER